MSNRKDIYIKTYTEDDAPGVDAICNKEKEIYGDQEPVHWATITPFELGGEEPLWAVDCFTSTKQETHLHFISLGFTNLWFDEQFSEDEINGFGFELTFRHFPVEDDPEQPSWAAGFIQNIAKLCFPN